MIDPPPLKQKQIDDGGPAFPVSGTALPNGDFVYPAGGMTLRDYFAAAALQGLIAQANGTALCLLEDDGAEYAYRMADAMLRARKVPA